MSEKTEQQTQLNIDWTDNGEPWECFDVHTNRGALRYFDKTFVSEVQGLYADSTADPVKMTSVLRNVAGEFQNMGLNDVENDRAYDHIMGELKVCLAQLGMAVEETYWHEPNVSWDLEWFDKNLPEDRTPHDKWTGKCWEVAYNCYRDDSGGEHIESVLVSDDFADGSPAIIKYRWSFVGLEENPEKITILFQGSPAQIKHIVTSALRGKKEIMRDVSAGTVPSTVECFDDLDMHVDHAMYGGMGDDGWFAALGQSCVDAGVMGSDADPSDACDPDQCKEGIHDSLYGWGIQADAMNALHTALSVWIESGGIAGAETEDEKIRRVATEAEFAFWEVVTKHYPDSKSDGWMCDLQSEENVSLWIQSEAGGE